MGKVFYFKKTSEAVVFKILKELLAVTQVFNKEKLV